MVVLGPFYDLGCGLGLLVELGSKWGLEISGLDGSEVGIGMAIERSPRLNVKVPDLSEPLPLAAGTVNNIVLFQVISHLILIPDVSHRHFLKREYIPFPLRVAEVILHEILSLPLYSSIFGGAADGHGRRGARILREITRMAGAPCLSVLC
jgi:SAM-dependent methyltransferase